MYHVIQFGLNIRNDVWTQNAYPVSYISKLRVIIIFFLKKQEEARLINRLGFQKKKKSLVVLKLSQIKGLCIHLTRPIYAETMQLRLCMRSQCSIVKHCSGINKSDLSMACTELHHRKGC